MIPLWFVDVELSTSTSAITSEGAWIQVGDALNGAGAGGSVRFYILYMITCSYLACRYGLNQTQ